MCFARHRRQTLLATRLLVCRVSVWLEPRPRTPVTKEVPVRP